MKNLFQYISRYLNSYSSSNIRVIMFSEVILMIDIDFCIVFIVIVHFIRLAYLTIIEFLRKGEIIFYSVLT